MCRTLISSLLLALAVSAPSVGCVVHEREPRHEERVERKEEKQDLKEDKKADKEDRKEHEEEEHR